MLKKLIFTGWILASLLLFFYSFTQVDLGLTLSRISVWQRIQQFFQFIGYFNRPLSTGIFLFLLFLFFFLFLTTFYLTSKKELTRKEIYNIIFWVSGILFFSYNAFSYDLFNYIFDAKIVTFYKQNPYFHKALDYPSDPMLSFMHWTHRAYPYGPVWLGLTIPLSYVGLGYFLPTLYFFKLIAAASYLGSVFLLEKLIARLGVKNVLLGIVFFALNPLVLVEFLVSAHNDIVMMFLAILSLYLLFEKRFFLSIASFLASVGIKFVTIFLLPFYLWIFYAQIKNKTGYYRIIFYSLLFFMIIPVVLASYRTNFQPWYLVYFLPFAALLIDRYFVLIPSVLISFSSLLLYLPFLYLGNWNSPVPQILFLITSVSLSLSFLIVAFVFFFKRFHILR